MADVFWGGVGERVRGAGDGDPVLNATLRSLQGQSTDKADSTGLCGQLWELKLCLWVRWEVVK